MPATGAYLGAWVHPEAPASGSSFAVEQAALPTVRRGDRSPAGHPARVCTVGPTGAGGVAARRWPAAGSIPLLDWGCGPDVAQLSTGVDDALISAYASDLRAYGAPVLLRWCWEMNLVGLHPQVGGPSGFTSAWDHIRTLFQRAGATNVSFVWCPALTGVDPQPYYPGAAEVDWIAVDGYDRDGTQTFGSLFTPFYRSWVGQGKPMMVAETGASGSAQPGFIDSIGTDAAGDARRQGRRLFRRTRSAGRLAVDAGRPAGLRRAGPTTLLSTALSEHITALCGVDDAGGSFRSSQSPRWDPIYCPLILNIDDMPSTGQKLAKRLCDRRAPTAWHERVIGD